MKLKKMIEEKKVWRAQMKRVKKLPKEYQVVYKESQKYLFKVAPAITAHIEFFEEILDLFEEGVMNGKSVFEVTGKDIAAFNDSIVESRGLGC